MSQLKKILYLSVSINHMTFGIVSIGIATAKQDKAIKALIPALSILSLYAEGY